MNHYSSMSTHFGNQTPYPNEVQRRPQHHQHPAGDFIPMPIPPNHHHPFFDEPGHEEPQHHPSRPYPPVHHQHSHPDQPQHHDHALNEWRVTNLEAKLGEFMEDQRRSNRDLTSRLEFFKFDLDGKFGNLSDQIERVETRCIDVEEELKKQAEAVKDNTRAIQNTNLATKEMDNHLDEKITSLDNNLNGHTESLNSVTLVAHQAKKKAAEVSLKERQCYSTTLVLVEGQAQIKRSIHDLNLSVDRRYQHVLRRTEGVSQGLENLTNRLAIMEDQNSRATTPKHGKALAVLAAKETNPRTVWDEIDRRDNEGPRLTARIRGRRPSAQINLSPRASLPPLSKEKKRTRAADQDIIDDFNFMARKFPYDMAFERACDKSPYLQNFVWNHDWSLKEVEKMYDEARKGMPKPRTLHKLQDPGSFFIHCSINGKYFDDCLCDSGASVNLMPAVVARELGLIDSMEPTFNGIKLADNSMAKALGELENVPLDFGGCIVPTDFYVVVMEEIDDMSLILGRSFMATAGAIMDWPNRRISLANIDKDTFYSTAPPGLTSKRFRYTSGGENSQVRGQPHGYLIEEILQAEMPLESSRTRRRNESPTILHT